MPRDRIESPVLHKFHARTLIIPGQHLGEIKKRESKTKVIIALRTDSLTNLYYQVMSKNIKDEQIQRPRDNFV